MLRCAQSPRVNVLPMYASAQPVLSGAEGSIFRAPRLWIFLSSLQEAFFQQPAIGRKDGVREYMFCDGLNLLNGLNDLNRSVKRD